MPDVMQRCPLARIPAATELIMMDSFCFVTGSVAASSNLFCSFRPCFSMTFPIKVGDYRSSRFELDVSRLRDSEMFRTRLR